LAGGHGRWLEVMDVSRRPWAPVGVMGVSRRCWCAGDEGHPAETGRPRVAVHAGGRFLIQERNRSYRSSGGELSSAVKSSRASYIWAER
jgi:hypothetical protein